MKLSDIKFANLKTKPKILIGICSPLVLLMMLGGISVYSITSIVDTNESVNHTFEVLGDAAGIVSSAVDMETGMRGFLLAGEEGFLDPYRAGEAATYSGIATLQEIVNDNPNQGLPVLPATSSTFGNGSRRAGGGNARARTLTTVGR